ncbi:unnamed protein product, partial [Didymodactylos carnosus]
VQSNVYLSSISSEIHNNTDNRSSSSLSSSHEKTQILSVQHHQSTMSSPLTLPMNITEPEDDHKINNIDIDDKRTSIMPGLKQNFNIEIDEEKNHEYQQHMTNILDESENEKLEVFVGFYRPGDYKRELEGDDDEDPFTVDTTKTERYLMRN